MAAGVQFNHIPLVVKKLHTARKDIVRITAFKVEREAKSNAPVDRGLLKNSIYTVTEDTSGAHAADLRMVKRKRVGSRFAQETFDPVPPTGNPGRALVLVGAKYGLFVELGTSHMRAQPFLLPAARLVQSEYLDHWRKLESRLR